MATISALSDRANNRVNSPIAILPILRSDIPEIRDKVCICCGLSRNATLSAMHVAVASGRPILIKLERTRLSGVEQAPSASKHSPAAIIERRIANLLIVPVGGLTARD
jgi:hypothetical protein